MADNPGQMDYPVRMECRGLLGHLVVMDVTKPKETWGARGRLHPRDHLVLKEWKDEPGIQGPTGQKGERGDKGERGTPQLSSHMNWTAPGNRRTKKIQARYM